MHVGSEAERALEEVSARLGRTSISAMFMNIYISSGTCGESFTMGRCIMNVHIRVPEASKAIVRLDRASETVYQNTHTDRRPLTNQASTPPLEYCKNCSGLVPGFHLTTSALKSTEGHKKNMQTQTPDIDQTHLAVKQLNHPEDQEAMESGSIDGAVTSSLEQAQ